MSFSGTVDDKTRFTNLAAQVTLSFNPPEPPNPIQINIIALPALVAKNSFYWYPNETDLAFGGKTLRSTLKPLFTRRSDIGFYYMSPALYRTKQALTQREAKRIRWMDTCAKPIYIVSDQGELNFRVRGNQVTGDLWMIGFDTLDNRPVRYTASFTGQKYVSEKTKH